MREGPARYATIDPIVYGAAASDVIDRMPDSVPKARKPTIMKTTTTGYFAR
jgi:hypothetical protein